MNRKYGIWSILAGFLHFMIQLFVAPGPLIWGNPMLLGVKYGIIFDTSGIVSGLFFIRIKQQLKASRKIAVFYYIISMVITILFIGICLFHPYEIVRKSQWLALTDSLYVPNPALRWFGSIQVCLTFIYRALYNNKKILLFGAVNLLIILAGLIILQCYAPVFHG